MSYKRIISLLILVIVGSCIDRYEPDLKNYKSLLVVEGLVTDENCSYKISLKRTTKEKSSTPEKVNDASVYITDGYGGKILLQNYGNGLYKTDSTAFTGSVGNKYSLHILTSDGKEYESEECIMFAVAAIDKIYYEKGEEIQGNLGESFTGLKILLNTGDFAGKSSYFRWTFEETWKTLMPGAQKFSFIKIDSTTFTFRPLPVGSNICWKKYQSGDIIINSAPLTESKYIKSQQIQFIDPIKSDRLTRQYSILVRQYSVSENEHDFWKNLKKASEVGGDIFASIPYTVLSNIHNVNDLHERVLGYFEVSAVSQKRIYITASDLESLYLPQYSTDCILDTKSPDDYPPVQPSFEDIYNMYNIAGGYVFVGPILTYGTDPESVINWSKVVKLVFATNVCAKCELSGFNTKPDFWIDLE